MSPAVPESLGTQGLRRPSVADVIPVRWIADDLARDWQLPVGRMEGQERGALVADDDAAIRCIVVRALKAAGFAIIEAADGRRAIQLAALYPPSLAVIDLEMPKCDGFRVIEALRRQRGCNVHTIVLSGRSDLQSRVRAFATGADDFVAKPCTPRELLARVRAARRALDERRRLGLELELAPEVV